VTWTSLCSKPAIFGHREGSSCDCAVDGSWSRPVGGASEPAAGGGGSSDDDEV